MEVKLANTRDLQSGKMMGIESNGKSILVVNLNGEFYAIGNICTHMGCILAETKTSHITLGVAILSSR